MSNVIALDGFRDKADCDGLEQVIPRPRPNITGRDVWTRDYSKLENALSGLLKVREIIYYYANFLNELDHLFMDVVEAVGNPERRSRESLKTAIAPLKSLAYDLGEGESKKHLNIAVLILDLIEKTPGNRNQ